MFTNRPATEGSAVRQGSANREQTQASSGKRAYARGTRPSRKSRQTARYHRDDVGAMRQSVPCRCPDRAMEEHSEESSSHEHHEQERTRQRLQDSPKETSVPDQGSVRRNHAVA